MSLYSNLFMDFCVLGGMPEVVQNYIEKGTFEGSLQTQRQLIEDYKEDIRKYAYGLDQGRILNVYNHIPVQLSKENKKFQISKVSHGTRFKDYVGCVEWLKLYFSDVGLFVASLDDESQEDLWVNRNFGVYKGALYENIVAEAFYKSGLPLYYYKKENSTLEEDFFVRTMHDLIRVEVKAKKGTSKSLQTLIQSDRYSDSNRGIKNTSQNIGYSNSIMTIPYFCAFLLKRFLKTWNE